MFNTIVEWIKGAVDFMAAMLSGDSAKEIVKIVLGIVKEVQATGKSGADKRALAFTLLIAKLPEIIELAVKLMKTEEECTDKNKDGKCDKDQCFDNEGNLISCEPDCPDGTC